MDMHGRIMTMRPAPPALWAKNAAWAHGSETARHSAAEIASEGDALIAEMLAALGRLMRSFPTDGDMQSAG